MSIEAQRPTIQRPTASSAPLRARPTVGSVLAGGSLIALVVAGGWAVWDLKINAATFIDGFGNAARFADRAFPLDFPPFWEVVQLCAQTLAIVILATLLSTLMSIPLAFLAAANTTPNKPMRFASRALIVVARATPDVVLAIIFVRVFGIGALTGVLAMALHSIGMIGKMYADAIEQTDPGPDEAIATAGATRLQRIGSGVLPQVLPAFVAVGLHRLDINLRVSVVLGFVGVGGIGYAIAEALKVLNYQRGLALAVVVLGLCIAVELLSGSLRSMLLGREAAGPRRGITGAIARRFTHRPSVDDQVDVDRDLTRDPRIASAAALIDGRLSPPWDARRVRSASYAVVTAVMLVASMIGTGINPVTFFMELPAIIQTLGQFLPPETGGIMGSLIAALWVTIEIALAGTLIGVVLSLPIGALAARNVAPNPRVAALFRLLILGIRGIPELVLAIVLVVITGLGEVAGAVALGIGGIGLMGKLVADSLEESDPGPEHALTAAGGSRLQVFFAATVPLGTKALVAHALYLLDTNIRAATLLGIVGAGGIGFYLLNAARVLQFGVVTTVLLLIFAAVMVVELLAIWLRSRW